MGVGSIIYCKGVAEWSWSGFGRIRRDADGRGDTPFFLFAERYINFMTFSLSRSLAISPPLFSSVHRSELLLARSSLSSLIDTSFFVLAAIYVVLCRCGKIRRSTYSRGDTPFSIVAARYAFFPPRGKIRQFYSSRRERSFFDRVFVPYP